MLVSVRRRTFQRLAHLIRAGGPALHKLAQIATNPRQPRYRIRRVQPARRGRRRRGLQARRRWSRPTPIVAPTEPPKPRRVVFWRRGARHDRVPRVVAGRSGLISGPEPPAAPGTRQAAPRLAALSGGCLRIL